ncbi:hypothetical protein SO802_035355 [Lithocarpus litseifolius]|uniref:Uncharacterized protein n=1 Tax=Lithocarpus litseifolius TaxID=425828 RepID=A0AAW2BD02_9ROSI
MGWFRRRFPIYGPSERGVRQSARNASLHLLASFQLRMLGLLRQVGLLGSASSWKRSFYDESLLSFSTLAGGESSKSLRVSLRLLSASLIGRLSPLLKIPFIRGIFCCRDALVRPTTLL